MSLIRESLPHVVGHIGGAAAVAVAALLFSSTPVGSERECHCPQILVMRIPALAKFNQPDAIEKGVAHKKRRGQSRACPAS